MVHLDAPLDICRERDKEGLYGAAERGEIANFPGISSTYEPPEQPDLVLHTQNTPPDECVQKIIELLKAKQMLG